MCWCVNHKWQLIICAIGMLIGLLPRLHRACFFIYYCRGHHYSPRTFFVPCEPIVPDIRLLGGQWEIPLEERLQEAPKLRPRNAGDFGRG